MVGKHDIKRDNTAHGLDAHHQHNNLATEFETQLSDENAQRMALTFKGLSDPTRLKLVHLLLRGEICVGCLAEATQTSQSAVSHQLRVLRNLRFVSSRREGQQIFYRINDEHIGELFQLALDHTTHMDEAI